MTRRNKEYISIDSGETIEADTLLEAIEQHPEIEQVVLFWTWHNEYFSSYAGPFEAYVSENHLDEEYSFQGGREDALDFAKSYDCWDGFDFVLLRGKILYGFEERSDYQTSWTDGCDHINGISSGIDPSWISEIRVDYDYKTNTEYVLEPKTR